jgi:hypothetical protein
MKIHKTSILHSVLYQCRSMSLSLIEDHGQRIFQEECLVAYLQEGEKWIKLYATKRHDLYSR